MGRKVGIKIHINNTGNNNQLLRGKHGERGKMRTVMFRKQTNVKLMSQLHAAP
jgi:hypothetical protein